MRGHLWWREGGRERGKEEEEEEEEEREGKGEEGEGEEEREGERGRRRRGDKERWMEDKTPGKGGYLGSSLFIIGQRSDDITGQHIIQTDQIL